MVGLLGGFQVEYCLGGTVHNITKRAAPTQETVIGDWSVAAMAHVPRVSQQGASAIALVSGPWKGTDVP